MADPRDLCTLADVRELMGKKPSDTTQDAMIAKFISRASVKIMRDYGREFVPGGPEGLPASNATRTFEFSWGDMYPGEAFVDLRPYDLQVTPAPSLAVDTDQSSSIALTSEEWRLWPQPPSQGVFMAVKVLPLNVSVGLIGWRKRQLQVTGTWGFSEVPFEVVQACAETVLHWVTAFPPALRPEVFDAASVPVTPRSYPMSALDLLSSFRRMTV